MAFECYRDAQYSLKSVLAPRAAGARAVLPPEVLWHPDATRRPLASDMGGVLTLSRGLILHVQEGDNSPYPWFARPDVKASSHWWVARDGALEQFVPADRVAWAQSGGNGLWHSVETEGFHGEGLTREQVVTLGRLYAWGHDRWGWDLGLAETPAGVGLGWHGMGGAAWGSHPDCPGELRKGQRPQIISAALGDEQEDSMPTAVEVVDELERRMLAGMQLAEQPGANPAKLLKLSGAKPSPWEVLGRLYFKIGGIESPTLTGLAAKIDAIGAALQTIVGPDHPAATALTSRPTLALDDLRAAVPGLTVAEAVALASAAISYAGSALAEADKAAR